MSVSTVSSGIVVFQNEEGSYSWLGQYNGMSRARVQIFLFTSWCIRIASDEPYRATGSPLFNAKRTG
jgi:hypothetical protein